MEFVVGERLAYNIYQGKDDSNNAKLMQAKRKMVLEALQYN